MKLASPMPRRRPADSAFARRSPNPFQSASSMTMSMFVSKLAGIYAETGSALIGQ